MPTTFKGFGTKYYGSGDERPDGSFITTEFVTAIYVPLLPFRSFRVIRAPQQDEHLIVVHTRAYKILERVPLAWSQILGIYLFEIFIVGWLVFALPYVRPGGGLVPKDESSGSMLLGVACFTTALLVPFLLVFWLRKFSPLFRHDVRRRMRPESELLLVCAGSTAGRVPFAMVSRTAGAMVTRSDCWLRFSSDNRTGPTWSFEILVRDDRAAAALTAALRTQKIHSLSPADFGIRTIVFYRDDWGSQPRWIGGDISAARVDPTLYRLAGNNAYHLGEKDTDFLASAHPPP